MDGENVLECRGLRRSFGKLSAVDGVGFHIFVGTLFRNEQQAIGISLLLGLGLGALGGCMVPLEVFSPTVRRIAHV
ncbi:MAG TPA: hypothetical protein VFQ68_36920, partial [Streptosporangiaceae bacterium]|nr:hypothetical protein [Streptosporangiaceae bacterium]